MAAKQAGLSLGGQVFFGSLCAGTFGLGVWQTQRYYEKVQQVAERQRDLALEPAPAKVLIVSSGHSNSWRRIRVQGRFHHDRELLVGPRGPPPGYYRQASGGMNASPQGYFVVTPMTVWLEEENGKTKSKNQEVKQKWWWWGKQRQQTTTSDEDDASRSSKTCILVNRGWVPRQLVVGNSRRRTESASLAWDRPSETVQLTVVPIQPEQPKAFLIPQHELQQTPPRLFWYDLPAMLTAARLTSSPAAAPLVTAVRETTTTITTWPVPPTADSVGDFSVHPATHVGYAATWYGLSAAGLYMTRRLLLRR